MNTAERIERILMRQIHGLRPEHITRDADLVRDLGADSLDLIQIAFAVYDEFGVDISEEKETLRTVARLCDYVESATREKQ